MYLGFGFSVFSCFEAMSGPSQDLFLTVLKDHFGSVQGSYMVLGWPLICYTVSPALFGMFSMGALTQPCSNPEGNQAWASEFYGLRTPRLELPFQTFSNLFESRHGRWRSQTQHIPWAPSSHLNLGYWCTPLSLGLKHSCPLLMATKHSFRLHCIELTGNEIRCQ